MLYIRFDLAQVNQYICQVSWLYTKMHGINLVRGLTSQSYQRDLSCTEIDLGAKIICRDTLSMFFDHGVTAARVRAVLS